MKTKNLPAIIFCLIAFLTLENASGFSIHKPVPVSGGYDAAKYLKVSELVKLSAKQFGDITGRKMNVWDKASFAIAKIKMKHDLKKNPDLTLRDYTSSGPFLNTTSKVVKILYYILIGLLLFFVILLAVAGSK